MQQYNNIITQVITQLSTSARPQFLNKHKPPESRVEDRLSPSYELLFPSNCKTLIIYNHLPSVTFQGSTASGKTTAPRRHVETGPSAGRSKTATSARVPRASRARIARRTSTNATGTRAYTAPARTFTDLTSKSNDIVNGLSSSILHTPGERKLLAHDVSDKTPRGLNFTRTTLRLFLPLPLPPLLLAPVEEAAHAFRAFA